MAKNTQEAEVIVTMNGEAAKKTLADITQKYKQLQDAALDAYKAGNDALGKKLDTEAQKLMKDIQITRNETKKFADVMKNINSASLKELNGAAKQLRSEINKLTPGTQEFINKSKQLQQVNTRIKQLQQGFRGVVEEEKRASLSLKGLADGFNKYFGMVTAGIAAITGLSMAFRKCAEEAAKLDDVYSDVMKTTGLVHDEVEELDKALMQIDTRTSREQLLLLARDAGKLGITGTENILGFVRAADQIQVALGEDLGDGAIRNLGKIADVLGYTSSMGIEQSLLSIASAVNAVGQASTASESYLVDFTQRLAGVAAQTNISAANIIGFASGLDQSAMKVEMAATAFQKFLMKLYEDPAKFAQYANMEVKQFSDLLANDANQAIITVLKSLKDQDGFASLVPIFKDMGLDGARAVSVLAAMATNINAVTEAQALANEEFESATSVSEEYTVKNNNLNAQLEKARKEFHNASIELGQSLNPIMLKSTKATTYLIKALSQYGKEIKAVVIALAALTVVVKAQAIAEGIRAVALKVSNTLSATGTVLSNKLMAAYYRLTGQTLKMAAAQKAANAAMSTSVIGAIAVAVAALTFAIARYVNKLKEANKELSYTEELEKRIGEEQNKETARVIALTKIVNDQNIAYGKRKEALEELKKIVPGYHASLTEEGKLINNNKTAIDEYVKSLKAATRMKILEDEFTDIQDQLMDAEDAYKKATADLNEAMLTPQPLTRPAYDVWEQKINHLGKVARDAKEDLDALQKKEQELMGKIGSASSAPGATGTLNTDNGGGNGGGGGGGGGNTSDPNKKAFDAGLAQLELAMQNEENILKRSLLNREISQSEYNAKINLLTMRGLQSRIELARKYGQDETKYVSQLLDMEIKLVGDGMEKLEEEIEYVAQIPTQGGIVDPQANEDFWNQVMAKRNEIVSGLKDQSLKDDYDNEMRWIEKLHEQELLSEEQFQQAKLQTKMKFAQDYAQKFQAINEQASNFVNALKEYETQKAEAEYQAQLTAAGDNAEQREAVEAAYEQKKLDIQKKYADTEMVINIAKTVAAGALAAIQAFAQLGPIGGAVAAALIAVTTALEVATIVQQRNAIKNASVNNSGSSSVPKTGNRAMTGYAEGGYTEDHTTVTTVGERGREWVAPHWMVQQNPVHFANLERYRRIGSHGRSGSIAKGFAEGGFTGSNAGSSAGLADSNAAIEQAVFNGMRQAIEGEWIRAYLVRKDLSEIDNQDARFKKQTSR